MTPGRSIGHDGQMAPEVPGSGLARLGFVTGSWLFVTCLVIQVFLVGLDVFARIGGSVHRDFAYVYGWLAPILVLLAEVARVPRRTRTLTVVLLVLFAVQTVLPSLRDQVPILAALHPVNALAIFGLAIVVARRATGLIGPDPGHAEGR